MTVATPRMPDEASNLLLRMGIAVRSARSLARLNQSELAERAGVSRIAVSRLETGKPVASWVLALVMRELDMRFVDP